MNAVGVALLPARWSASIMRSSAREREGREARPDDGDDRLPDYEGLSKRALRSILGRRGQED